MEINDLISMLTEGLEPDQAAIVKKAIERDSVKAKVSPLKQQKEYDAIMTQYSTLKAEMEGDAATGKLGAAAYRQWYQQNEGELKKLMDAQKKYIDKYGKFDGSFEPPAATTTTTAATTTTATPSGKQWTEEDIQRAVDARIQGGYAPRWATLLKNTGAIVQKHMYAKRTAPIDFEALEKIATEKTNGDLMSAYDEWDKPEREKQAKADEESRIEKRVQEELQKRGASQYFPVGSDASPGVLSRRSGDERFDRAAMTQDLVNTYVTGLEPGKRDGFFTN